jgi:hypothetical protein
MRDYQLGLGIPREQVYNQTMMILAGLLGIGLVCNLLIRPVADKWFMNSDELAEEKRLAQEHDREEAAGEAIDGDTRIHPAVVYLAWTLVGMPLAWGIYKTLMNVSKFFA